MKCVKIKLGWRLVLLLLILLSCSDKNNRSDRVYLVEETNYIHKDSDCKYLKDAKDNDYKIINTYFSIAPYYEYEICLECFSVNDLNKYRHEVRTLKAERLAEQKERARKDSILKTIDDETKKIVIEAWFEEQEAEDYLYKSDDGEYYLDLPY